jgi:hypothetical protein
MGYFSAVGFLHRPEKGDVVQGVSRAVKVSGWLLPSCVATLISTKTYGYPTLNIHNLCVDEPTPQWLMSLCCVLSLE